MKQVVGSPFWGLTGDVNGAERDVIADLVAASHAYADMPLKSPAFNVRKKKKLRDGILKKVRALLNDRLQIYLHAIVNKLFDNDVPLGKILTERRLLVLQLTFGDLHSVAYHGKFLPEVLRGHHRPPDVWEFHDLRAVLQCSEEEDNARAD